MDSGVHNNFEISLNSLKQVGNIDICKLCVPNGGIVEGFCSMIEVLPHPDSNLITSKNNIQEAYHPIPFSLVLPFLLG